MPSMVSVSDMASSWRGPLREPQMDTDEHGFWRRVGPAGFLRLDFAEIGTEREWV